MKRLVLSLGLLSLAAALSACSNVSANPTSTDAVATSAPAGDTVTITARDLKFGQSEITVPAAKAFQLVFDNQEGAPHNVAIYTDSSASTKVSIGEIFGGPGQRTQTVPALAAGSYFFRCDVHPDMQGAILAQ
jgi:plastocyanin